MTRLDFDKLSRERRHARRMLRETWPDDWKDAAALAAADAKRQRKQSAPSVEEMLSAVLPLLRRDGEAGGR